VRTFLWISGNIKEADGARENSATWLKLVVVGEYIFDRVHDESCGYDCWNISSLDWNTSEFQDTICFAGNIPQQPLPTLFWIVIK
jgi:hypothetical protein